MDPANKERGTVWITEDVTDTHATREALHQPLREMEAIMANASVGILITRTARWSATTPASAKCSATPGIRRRRPARNSTAPTRNTAKSAARPAPAFPGQALPKELFMRRQDGSDQWTNLIGYVADPEDTTRGTFWILEDRSAYKQSAGGKRSTWPTPSRS